MHEAGYPAARATKIPAVLVWRERDILVNFENCCFFGVSM
jgi:hypothetical protein